MTWLPVEVSVAPAEEPLTLAEAAAQCRLEVGEDDSGVTACAKAARAHVEAFSGTRLVTQTVKMRCNEFCSTLWLPIGPVQSITSVKYLDTDGAEQTLATSVYDEYLYGISPYIALTDGQNWPSIYTSPASVIITAVVGYGLAAAVPDDIKHALKLLTAQYYDQRGAISDKDMSLVPNGVDALLANHRRYAF